MLRSTLRLVAAALLAVGLVFAPSVAGAKSKKADKTSSRDSKKDSKRDKKDKTAKKDKGKKDKGKKDKAKKGSRSDDRTAKHKKHDSDRVAKSSKRGKNDGDDDDDDNRSSRARRTAPPSPTVAKRVVDSADADDGDDGDEAEEPPGPKPATRVVADMAPVRVMQIQSALISKGLLVGPPNGVYDQPTFQAMAAFQTRNGWTGVGVPTADSLKALGVPKTSGRTFMTPARVVEATAPPPQ